MASQNILETELLPDTLPTSPVQVPPPVICEVCLERPVMNANCSASCQHSQNTCGPCVHRWYRIKISNAEWRNLECISCTTPLSQEDVERVTSPSTLREYNKLRGHPITLSVPCVTRGCRSTEQVLKRRKYTCAKCGVGSCVHCREYLHVGPCEKHELDNICSKEWFAINSKSCPKCRIPFVKEGGCMLVMCTGCMHQFCWECLGAYDVSSGWTDLDSCSHALQPGLFQQGEHAWFMPPHRLRMHGEQPNPTLPTRFLDPAWMHDGNTPNAGVTQPDSVRALPRMRLQTPTRFSQRHA